MTVRIIDEGPDPSVVKTVVCRRCGAKLEYVPNDVTCDVTHHYDGSSGTHSWIKCPGCSDTITVGAT